MEVIPWRRGEVERGRRRKRGRVLGGGGWRYSPEIVMLETSDAQLGVQAGGWECSFGATVWVVMGEGDSGIRRGKEGGHDLWYQRVILGSL